MSLETDKLISLFEEETNITNVARKYASLMGIGYDDNLRRKISGWKNRNMSGSPDDYFDNQTITTTPQYSNDKQSITSMPSAWDSEIGRFLTPEEFCDKYGLDKNSIRSSKLISHIPGHMTYNLAMYSPEEEAVLNIEEHLEEIITKHIKPVQLGISKNLYSEHEYFDRLVFTDVHLAMDVQGNGDPLYDGKWDREEALERLKIMIQHTADYSKGTSLHVDNLGDFLDGLGGETTRKGHKLPQNMNDKECFELGIEFNMILIESLLPYYENIVYNIITNDNHSGVFGYFVASSTKKILEGKYPEKVSVNVVKRFMEHYSVGSHTFVILHGKDMGEQRYGFKPKLDTVQMEKLDQYCKEHKLYNGNFIEISKGDSHQAIYDDTTSNDFQYYNYPAFSPPSNWVKTNFKNSKSGFRFYNIHREKDIKITIPYFF